MPWYLADGGNSIPKDKTINLRQLQYFTRVIETGSITRAAEELFVSQPALGLQIRLLEQKLGVSLLERHSRGVKATRAGEVLYRRGQEILAQVEETTRAVIAASSLQRENVLLGLTNGLIKVISRDLVQYVRAALPGVNLQLTEEMSGVLADGVERHDIDLALAYEIPARPGLVRVPLIKEELVFAAAANGSAEPDAIEFSALMDRPLVLPNPRDGTYQLVKTVAEQLAYTPNVVLEVTSVAATIHMVVEGDAESIIPYATAKDHLEQGLLISRRIVNPPIKRTLYLVRAARRPLSPDECLLLDELDRQVMAFAEYLGDLATVLEPLALPLSRRVMEAQASRRPIE